jgi:chromosome condensin MukBEF ATPase and DNA-binding subunit MukB
VAAGVLAFLLLRERAKSEWLERLLNNAEEREEDARERLEQLEAERDRMWPLIGVDRVDGERIRRELAEAKARADRARRSLQDRQRGFDQPGLRNDTGEPNPRWTTPSPVDPSKVKPGDRDTPPPEVEQRWPAR